MAEIKIKDLLLRTQVGFNEHEIGKRQDLIINITVEYDLQGEERSDNPDEALNYRSLCKEIIDVVESRSFNLIEHVAILVCDCLFCNLRINKAFIEVEKPHALRFARSVSFGLTKTRGDYE